MLGRCQYSVVRSVLPTPQATAWAGFGSFLIKSDVFVIGTSFLNIFCFFGLVLNSVRAGMACFREWPLTLMEKSVSERCGGGSYREKQGKVFSAVGAAATATSGASYVDSCVSWRRALLAPSGFVDALEMVLVRSWAFCFNSRVHSSINCPVHDIIELFSC